ncbi:MAG: dUTP diphosphatase [Magnetococcales bacterium]|nr:dUTP diphosphatase [Magnetococcales bacterium]
MVLPHGEGLPLPETMSRLAAGADLRAAVQETVVIEPGARALIPTGIAVSIPEGFEGQVRPRSGLALKHGVTVLNAPGTIDADYRGELGIILINHGDDRFQVTRGERIAQLIIAPISHVNWRSVTSLDETGRGEGGFGHTGR